MTAAYIYLLAAIVFEVAGTVCMKLSEGFSKPVPAVLMGLSYVVCFGTLTMALKKIEVGMAYAIWAGVGIALIATVGAILFRESFTLSKGIALLLIISGVVLLNLVRSSH